MRHTPALTATRALAVVAVLALAATAGTGCGGPDEPATPPAATGAGAGPRIDPAALPSDPAAATKQIEDTLRQLPGVVKAKVDYSDNVTAPGSAAVSVTVKGGTPQQPVVDAAARLLWLSRLNPLRTISIGVVDEADKQKGTVKDLNLLTPDASDLLHRFGPRPR